MARRLGDLIENVNESLRKLREHGQGGNKLPSPKDVPKRQASQAAARGLSGVEAEIFESALAKLERHNSVRASRIAEIGVRASTRGTQGRLESRIGDQPKITRLAEEMHPQAQAEVDVILDEFIVEGRINPAHIRYSEGNIRELGLSSTSSNTRGRVLVAVQADGHLTVLAKFDRGQMSAGEESRTIRGVFRDYRSGCR